MKKVVSIIGVLIVSIFLFCCKKDKTNNTPGTPVPLNDNSIALSDSVVDAEYTRKKDLLVAVSALPNNMMIIDPVNKTVTTIALNLEPNCVSISPDGNYVVVGHNGWLSYFDLNTKTLIKMQAITCDAFDVVLTNNAWAYVFPENTQWDRIRCVNLAMGIENKNIGNQIYGNTKAKLHPSGTRIYGADNGSTPDDFERYNLVNDTANYVYIFSTANYTHKGDLWIPEDSSCIFAKSRNVFSCTNIISTDIKYLDTLSGTTDIITLDYSKTANKIYAVMLTTNIWVYQPDSVIRKYKANDRSFQGTITLPKLYIPNAQPSTTKKYYSYGYFGFFNSTGTVYYAIVKAVDGVGTHKKWAVVSVAVQ